MKDVETIIASGKTARINANAKNSELIRGIQKRYCAKFAPLKVSVEAIADMAMEIGLPLVAKKLNVVEANED